MMTGSRKRFLAAFGSAAALFFMFSSVSCDSKPGEGGTAVLRGKVLARDYLGSQFIREYYAPEERVYIIYGDDGFYNDDVRTSYDGSYEFPYLKKGRYTVFAYSDCDTCAAGVTPVFIHAEITRSGAVVDLPDLIIRK